MLISPATEAEASRMGTPGKIIGGIGIGACIGLMGGLLGIGGGVFIVPPSDLRSQNTH